jgi:signal recognition particle receptor subunit beta
MSRGHEIMASYDPHTGMIECKIVYYGPGRCGKTTNLEYIFEAFRKHTASDMVSIDTAGDRTLFFDFLPMGLGSVRGHEVKAHIFTVPGQVKYRSTRQAVLRGVDGVIFVADSLQVRWKANLMSLIDLKRNLEEASQSIFQLPLVVQYNKRDLSERGFLLMPLDVMERGMNRRLKADSFAASAVNGAGVWESLRQCLKLTLMQLNAELDWAR